jgi:hypothetical protein
MANHIAQRLNSVYDPIAKESLQQASQSTWHMVRPRCDLLAGLHEHAW